MRVTKRTIWRMQYLGVAAGSSKISSIQWHSHNGWLTAQFSLISWVLTRDFYGTKYLFLHVSATSPTCLPMEESQPTAAIKAHLRDGSSTMEKKRVRDRADTNAGVIRLQYNLRETSLILTNWSRCQYVPSKPWPPTSSPDSSPLLSSLSLPLHSYR